jgi:hypothetical protein
MRTIIKPGSKEEWLNERLNDITSTEISVLYNKNSRLDIYDLFFCKKNKVNIEVDHNERMQWGKALEDAIAQEASKIFEWNIEKFDVYIRDEDAKIGSSFDYKITKSKRYGRGILEIKKIDSGLFYNPKMGWEYDKEGNVTKAPISIELQVQHQLEVSNYDWTELCVLVGGSRLFKGFRERDRAIGNDIRQKAQKFWDDINNNNEPTVDINDLLLNAEDQDDIDRARQILSKLNSGKDVYELLEADAELDNVILRYKLAKSDRESMQFIEDKLRTEIMHRSSSYQKIASKHGTIHCKTRSATPGTLVTQDMVGTHINARKSFREFRFFEHKEQ